MAKLGKKGITLLVIGAVLVGGGLIYRASQPDVTYETEKIGKGTIVEDVSVTGSIAPKTRIDLQSEVSAKVAEIAVAAGDDVKEGDLLVRFDSAELLSRIAGQRASLEAAQALLDQYVAGSTQEELDVSKAAVASAKASYAAALTAEQDAETALATATSKAAVNLQTKVDALIQAYDSALTTASDAMNRLSAPLYTTGSEQLTFVSSDAASANNAHSTRLLARSALTDLESKVSSVKAANTATAAEAAYSAILSDLQAIKANMDASAVVLNYAILSDSVLSTYKTNISTARSAVAADITAVTAAKNALDLQESLNATEINTAQTALNNAESSVESARLAVQQAEANYNLKLAGVRPEQIAAQRAQVNAARASLSSLYAEYAKRSIEAPIDGIVTEVYVEKGENVQMGTTVVTMQGDGKFEIVANISEVDIAKLAVGDPVEITLDAFSQDETWTGTVVSIWPAEKVVEGVIFYETKILFDEEDERLKSGMTANLEIETGRAEDVLRLPLRALREEEGQRYVLVLNEDGETERRDIKIGLENSQYVQVTEGLSVGDEVVVAENKD